MLNKMLLGTSDKTISTAGNEKAAKIILDALESN